MDAALAAIHRFEAQTNFRDFRTFRHEQAVSFKHHLAVQTQCSQLASYWPSRRCVSILAPLKAFFIWLAVTRITGPLSGDSDSDFFNLFGARRPDGPCPA